MSVRLLIQHLTRYRYDRPVWIGPQVVRLRPTPYGPVSVVDYVLDVDPGRHRLHWFEDPFGNHVGRLIFAERTEELVLDVALTVNMAPINPFDFYLEDYASEFPFQYPPDLTAALQNFLQPTATGARMRDLLARPQVQSALEQGTVGFLTGVTGWLAEIITYNTRLEAGVQSCETTLTLGSGSCRDSAWLQVQLLRHLGLAARFVSGYLVQLAGNEDGPKEDSADLHAWCEVYLPGAGWVGMDATSGLLAAEGHIPLAAAASPEGAAPLTGQTDEAEVTMTHRMSVTRLTDKH